ncbi:hypothetical protein [Streptomyces sp. 8L]|uniref:hypothetical protein n=1 Tax=Streptomyces sp. 8L TaxID=2877242 RepID=UPI001CD5CD8B|nr:hypothetical protein [Streptomyces sp. 8L]MCA1222035.1 hypothetical protein [Streptomyces sp. 8L]
MEIAKFDVARFEAALGHLVEAADGANRYVAALGDIDATDYHQREPHVFRVLDPLGRARAEVEALPHFPGSGTVKAAIKMLGKLVAVPERNQQLLELWDPVGLGDAITILSRGRGAYMREAMRRPAPRWKRAISTLRASIGRGKDAPQSERRAVLGPSEVDQRRQTTTEVEVGAAGHGDPSRETST